MSEDWEWSTRLDARTLRGLAHPLRIQILGLLRAEGPATASGLAARLGESSGTTSWHLRQLAEHGFIEEDPDRGTKRDRWWRARHRYTEFDLADHRDDPAAREVLGVFLHGVADIHHRKTTEFLRTSEQWPEEWLRAAALADRLMWLRPEELTRLNADLEALLDRYERPRAEDDTPVTLQWQAFPRTRAPEGEK
ncbi:DNA-binding transcriptional ArsR family regulator [Crossiella equi]|uniref:DNA-binding transcriptional ArsR family regulator n=1 Tax=Crossiella equi TaxID=130796 RepID=A0ABS5A7X1_9PSEU|nr:winged helix-turn-helix domain-containing protein [Crossiella equi]MBP2472683.1 DNA-binding transcriptional ArsR family regulator [Crossiella equi]